MTDLISDEAVALSLMREALTLLDEPSNTDAVERLEHDWLKLRRIRHDEWSWRIRRG